MAELKEAQTLGIEIFKQRAVCQTIEDRLKQEKQKLEKLKNTVISHLEEADMEKISITGQGTLYIKEFSSVKTPKTEENKALFFDYLRERGAFDALISVNSRTLNSYYKDELEKAIEEGNSDFKIPGLEDPSFTKQLGIRKG